MRQRRPYKKLLSAYEIERLAVEHADSPVYTVNRKGERILEAWLKALRFNQAWQLAEKITKQPIGHDEFQLCWDRTAPPKVEKQPTPEMPNTATFGGYRLRTRAALNRAQKEKPRPK